MSILQKTSLFSSKFLPRWISDPILSFWQNPLTGSVLLFLSVWLLYGTVINAHNMQEFNLQHTGIEAIIERQQFYLEGSPTPQLELRGDVFVYKDHYYAAKQPGQFFLGAIAYGIIHLLGWSYQEQYLQTAALVTLFSSSLLVALSIVAIQKLSQIWLTPNLPLSYSYLTAIATALGTILFTYSGIPHHDSIAASLMVISFATAYNSRSFHSVKVNQLNRQQLIYIAIAGLCLGFTITTSMLPFFSVLVLCIYCLAVQSWHGRLVWMFSFILGLLPLLIYNWICFGNPFLLANIAGNYSDTFWRFDLSNLLGKLEFYSNQTLSYMPLLIIGLLGLFFLPKRLRVEQLTIGVTIIALLLYIGNIETVGHCQYGSRYLLPLTPLIMLGLNGFWMSRWKVIMYSTVLCVFTYSLLVNLAGAMGGAMYCQIQDFAAPRYWDNLLHKSPPQLPLSFLRLPWLLSCLMLMSWLNRRK